VLDPDPSFRPVRRRDGSVPWRCLPRFDSEPLFCGLLDAARGGAFIAAGVTLAESHQA